ncbi:MAG: O-antigen ligase domain-containing protein [Ketobacter sp.]|nr:MAG: O-antigen ligase domain-containing protein [Ketobacter sp.]
MRVSPFLFYSFFFAMFLPTTISINLGFMRMTPYRLILIVFFLMNLQKILLQFQFKRGNPGFYLVFCGFWSFLALWLNHDLALGLETGGINFIELTAPFFIVAAYAKDLRRYEKMIKILMIQVCLLLTISLPETVTGFNWFRTLTDAIFGGWHVHIDPRFGFDRAMATFDHPIINGVVSSSIIGFVYFCTRWWMTAFPVVATATSLSSGAIASIMTQFMLMGWERFVKVRKRWLILFGILFGIYLAAEFISNRSGVMAILSVLVFSPGTAYNRYYIWIYGTENVANNPFFGLGLNDWERPSYMGASIDNYWLVIMMRYGLPALISYVIFISIICRQLFRYRVKDKKLTALRRGWLTGLAGLCVSAGTVHYWNTAYIYFNFYIGLGFALIPLLRAAAMEERENKRKKASPPAEA